MAAPRKTLTVQVAELSALVAELIRAQAQAPVTQAPVQPKAEAPLYVSDKAPCAIHDACTRKLSNPAGSHEPCTGKGDPMHDKLRPSHRHF